MKTKTEAMSMQELAHSKFWLGVYLFYSRHALGKAERHTSPIRSRKHSRPSKRNPNCAIKVIPSTELLEKVASAQDIKLERPTFPTD
jgi:hypothetical protein